MEQNNAFLGTAPIGKLMRGYSMPVSDVLTFAVAAVLIAKTYRELGAAE